MNLKIDFIFFLANSIFIYFLNSILDTMALLIVVEYQNNPKLIYHH